MKKFFSIVVKLSSRITAALMLLMIVVVTVQIVARYVFVISTPWTEELARYLLIYIAFIGSVGVLIKGEHMLVDIFYNMFSPALKRAARVLNDIVFLFFSLFLLYFGIQLCTSPIIIHSLMPAMQISRVYLYWIMPFSMFFIAVYSAYELVMAVKALFSKETPEEKSLERSGTDA